MSIYCPTHLRTLATKHQLRRFCSQLTRTFDEPRFVTIGANDGFTGDPISPLILETPKWKGLLVEPVPYLFDRLQENFPDSHRFSLEQLAIGATRGEEKFYYVDANARLNLLDLPEYYDQLGSFDRNHILEHLNGSLEPYIIECKVPVLPLSDVLSRNNIDDIHLLLIDTEGHDYEVLCTLNFSIHNPLSIYIEHLHLKQSKKRKLLEMLYKADYSVRDSGSDYFAVARKSVHLLNPLIWQVAQRPILS